MSTLTSLLTRPSALGFLAVAGSGAFYVGLKYRTLTGPEGKEMGRNIGKTKGEGPKSYEVKPGREGGGV
ncbi:hypothetical protein JMJ35_005500 [Cladonia borealis]|uniref:Uncharacterized protein n=1 Tax=Cladonia borealis TaxID=184061 RepID=A0AA39QZY4_9LECA|nr:hypothetical protein JMJ35_005500 [Cladonia borealis]